MLKNNYMIYHDTMFNQWCMILKDLALNRFKWDLKEWGDSKYFETRLLLNRLGCCVYDIDLGYLFLGATMGDFNIYNQPTRITAIGEKYSKDYTNGILDSFVVCYENQSNLSLNLLITNYANDLANIDTTLFFLIKKLKQPYIWRINKNSQLSANIIQNQLETSDCIEVDEDFNLEEKLSVLNLNVSNQAIQELEILKNQKYSEILQLMGINTIEYEKAERLLNAEANINNQKVTRFISSSYNARLEFCEKVKKVFNIDIDVKINDSQLILNKSIIDNNNYSPVEDSSSNLEIDGDD